MGGERQQCRFAAGNVGEYPAEKTGFLGHAADRARVDPGEREEARKLVSLACQKSERGDRQFECRIISICPNPSPARRRARGLERSAPRSAIGFHVEIASLLGTFARRQIPLQHYRP